jgi:hypothetical protein
MGEDKSYTFPSEAFGERLVSRRPTKLVKILHDLQDEVPRDQAENSENLCCDPGMLRVAEFNFFVSNRTLWKKDS